VLDDHGEPLVYGAQEHPRARGLHFVGYRIELDSTFRTAGADAKRLARVVTRSRTQAAAAAATA
jgi:hypothetical protein